MTETKLIRLKGLRRLKERQIEARQLRARADFATAGQLAAAIDPRTIQTPALDLIDAALTDVAEGRCERLIISMPPQEGKSTRVTTMGPLWFLLRDPETRIAIASYGQDLAEEFGQSIRDLITANSGDEGTLDLGLRIAPDNGAARRWRLDGHRGGVRSVGLSSGLTGRPAEKLFIDDPIKSQEDADSQAWRDKVWGWWQTVGSTRLAPGAAVILILTRWHEDDLAGRLQAAEDGHRWRVINIPALADHKPEEGQSDPLGREPGQWLQSARERTDAEWEAIRIQVGTRVFTSLYQGRPSPASGNVWHREWWRRYNTPLWSQHPTIPDAYRVNECDELIMSWDMTFKDLKSSDWVVGQVWARYGADAYLLDQVRKRLSFTETVTAFQALHRRWPGATAKLVEDAANGPAVISTLHSKIPGIIAITPKGSKYARANAVAPMLEAGNVFLPAPEIALFDTEELVVEAASFPNGAHDDQVDAASQALARLFLDGLGAEAWIEYMKRRAEAAGMTPRETEPAAADASDAPEPSPTLPEPTDPTAALRAARNAAYRAHNSR